MSLVHPGADSPQSNMAHPRRASHNTRAPRNWLFLHLLACFIFLFSCQLCLQSYFISETRHGHAITESNNNINNIKTVTPHTSALIKSPLQELSWIETSVDKLSEEEIAIYSKIVNLAALDLKFFAIPETVYPQSENRLLYSYVEKQLKSARDMLTAQQAEFVLKLIESGVTQGSMTKKEVGDKGSLKNSVVIALMKEEGGNLHFAMAAVSVEPRLRWRLITKKQRNEWNAVLSRVADTRLKQEMMSGSASYMPSINNNKSEVKPEKSIGDSVVQALEQLFR